jgi:hypothetical protein
LLLAYVAALIPSLVMAITQPVWSRVDEAQHTDFIIQLSHGIYPIADITLIDPETLRVVQSTGVFRFDDPGTYPAPDLMDIAPPPAGMSVAANAVWMSRHMWQLSYESEQTPGYYVLMVPAWWVADALGGTTLAVYAMRAINALLIASLAPMAVVVAWRLFARRAEVAVTAALFAILLPGLALNGTRVSNDALAAAVGGFCVVLAVGGTGRPWTWRRSALLGLAFGAGLLVKLTLLALAPALALAMLWPAPGTSPAQRFARGAAPAAIAAACLLVWFAINLHLYGVPVPSARTNRLIDTAPVSFTPGLLLVDLAFFGLTYWTGEPIGALPLAAPLAVLGSLVSLIALAGLIRLAAARRARVPGGPLAVAVTALGAMIALALLLPATNAFKFAGPGRYAYAALPAAAAVCALGLFAAIQHQRARRALVAAYGVGALAVIVAGAGVTMSQPEARPPSPPAGSGIAVTGASNGVGGVSITVDRVALDRDRKGMWFHVAIANAGTDEAEWSPAPAASTGSAVGYGDYSKSTPMPGDVDPGQTSTGWLFVGLDPALLSRGGSVRLRFAGVAIDRYTTVGDVVIDVNVDALFAS